MSAKVVNFPHLPEIVERLKTEGKTVVQSHGVFDLIHPGVIAHLHTAKKQGDVLIVTIIKDKDVRKGPGRPIFNERLRAENVASLEQVDFVAIVDDDIPFECVKLLKPNVLAKGQAHKERDRLIHQKLVEEEKEFYSEQCKIYETEGFSFSSSAIINNFLDIYSNETKEYLRNFKSKYAFDDIVNNLGKLQDLKVLLIGDGIVDEYHYCETMGKSPKSQLIVNKYLYHEIFAGGVFAIANHIAGICGHVDLISLLGGEDSRESFISSNLRSNISANFFIREDAPSVIKKRYISTAYNNSKLFEVNFINDTPISEELEQKVITHIKNIISNYDLVIVSDFGHGLITNNIIRSIEKHAKKLAVNTQTNGANAGYNLITKYARTNFICLDDPEARLAVQDKHSSIEDVGVALGRQLNTDCLIITVGRDGSICITEDGGLNHTPAFATRVKDIIGAGDAYFAFSAPCYAIGLPIELVCFIGNAAGALAVQIVGNKKPVEKYELLEFINAVLK
ncbi:MAG: adenylyltransferase/cytidyltransferase family protein [Nitrospirae bacterium]|nr:adenylyltransferase/cytidyltransferase family protein [Nitrospirota bacterium]